MRVPGGLKSLVIGSAVKVEPVNGGAEMPKQPVLNRPLYTDKDKKLVLEEGDPKSAFVIGGEGSTVLDEDIEKYGLDESHFLVEEKPEDQAEAPEAEAKAAKPAHKPAAKSVKK